MGKAISAIGMKSAQIILILSLLVSNIAFINTGSVSAEADLPPDLTGIASGSSAITAGQLVLMEKEVADALLGSRWRTFPSSIRNWCMTYAYFGSLSADVRTAMCAFYAAGQLYPPLKYQSGIYTWDPDLVLTRYDMARATQKMVNFQRNYNEPEGTAGQYGMGSDTPHPSLLDLNAYTTYDPFDSRITAAYQDAGPDFTNGLIDSNTAQGIQLGSLPGNRILEPCYNASGDFSNTWPDERYANPHANYDQQRGARPPGYAYIPHLSYCGWIHQTADETRMNLSRWYCASLALATDPDGQKQGNFSWVSDECWDNYWVQSGNFQRGPTIVDENGHWNMRPYIEGVPAGTELVYEDHSDEDPSDDYTPYDADGWLPTSMSYWVGYKFNMAYYYVVDAHILGSSTGIVEGPLLAFGWDWAGPWFGFGVGPTVAAP